MKIAVTCDHILQQGHYLQTVEFVLEALKGSVETLDIYTFAHNAESASGTIGRYPIHGSYLSHLTKTPEDLFRKSWMIPNAAKNLQIPCSADIVFNISLGFSHGISKCKKTRQIIYLYQDYSPRSRFSEKIFTSFLRSWSLKRILSADQLWVASPSLFEYYRKFNPKTRLVEPGFPVGDSPLFSKEQESPFYAISTEFLTLSMAQDLVRFFEREKRPYKFLGPTKHLKKLARKNPSFIEEGCWREAIPLLAASHALIGLSLSHPRDCGFPLLPMRALACGRPVVVQDCLVNRELLGKLEGRGVYFIKNLEELPKALKELSRNPVNLAQLRALAMSYSELKFKAKIRRYLQLGFDKK